MRRKKSNTRRYVAISATVAGIAGYVAGVLTAPKAGKETRQDIANKAVDAKLAAERQLTVALHELDDVMKAAKAKSVSLNAKAREEFNEAMITAKDAQNKATQVLKAVKAGEADNPELNRAVKQARQAAKNLSKFLKN
ncbi:MAG TPA: YtxH domain-containing protein [Candidatus Binatia bacterium]|nr:YtxH domain-containing protein [Candidatus Binatia bacterium]